MKSSHGGQKRDLAMAFQVLRAASPSGELVDFLALVVVELADPPIGKTWEDRSPQDDHAEQIEEAKSPRWLWWVG
jgi:hypothetical protein